MHSNEKQNIEILSGSGDAVPSQSFDNDTKGYIHRFIKNNQQVKSAAVSSQNKRRSINPFSNKNNGIHTQHNGSKMSKNKRETRTS